MTLYNCFTICVEIVMCIMGCRSHQLTGEHCKQRVMEDQPNAVGYGMMNEAVPDFIGYRHLNQVDSFLRIASTECPDTVNNPGMDILRTLHH